MDTESTVAIPAKGTPAHVAEHSVQDGENVASDNAALAALGYKQEFKRSFHAIEVFGIGFSIIGLFPSIACVLLICAVFDG